MTFADEVRNAATAGAALLVVDADTAAAAHRLLRRRAGRHR
ncbi:hypothetical protein OG911_35045 [Streptomyces sp. NBC_00208]|nr:hypothetical protein [Streptomyces sp. NBC_00208]